MIREAMILVMFDAAAREGEPGVNVLSKSSSSSSTEPSSSSSSTDKLARAACDAPDTPGTIVGGKKSAGGTRRDALACVFWSTACVGGLVQGRSPAAVRVSI